MRCPKSAGTSGIFRFLSFCLLFAVTLGCCTLLAHGAVTVTASGAPPEGKSNNAEDLPSLPTVILDAGHGGEDGGTTGVSGVLEKDLNLSIAKKLEILLTAAGFPVIMTRTEDILLYDRNVDYHGRKKVLDLAARLKVAQEHPDAVFVSIHMNAYPQAKYSGLQVYYSPNSPESERLAERIQTLTAEALMPENHRKIKPSGGKIFLLDKMQNPSVLIECGFLSNPGECQALERESYQEELAAAIFAAIAGTAGA